MREGELSLTIANFSAERQETVQEYLGNFAVALCGHEHDNLDQNAMDSLGHTQLPWIMGYRGNVAIAKRVNAADVSWNKLPERPGVGHTLYGKRNGNLFMLSQGMKGAHLLQIIDVEIALQNTGDGMVFDPCDTGIRSLYPEWTSSIEQVRELPDHDPISSGFSVLTDTQRAALFVQGMLPSQAENSILQTDKNIKKAVISIKRANSITQTQMLSLGFVEGLIRTDTEIINEVNWGAFADPELAYIAKSLFEGLGPRSKDKELIKKAGLRTRNQLYLAALRDGAVKPDIDIESGL